MHSYDAFRCFFISFTNVSLHRLVVADDRVTGADDSTTGADDSVTGADDSVTGADDGVTGADDSVTGADDCVTGADDSVTGADDSVTGADDSVTGADDNVTGADDSVTGADDGVTGADDGVTGADGLAVDVVYVHVVGVLHCFLADLLQKGVAGNDFVTSLYFSSQHLHFFHTCSSFSPSDKDCHFSRENACMYWSLLV